VTGHQWRFTEGDVVGYSAARMNLISRQELKEKLDKHDDFKLVMVLGEWHYRAAHIPSSLHIGGPDDATKLLELNDEIVVYCSNEACLASKIAYEQLVAHGYTNVRRYAQGISDWMDAGYPIEGERVSPE
jgi:rhodanese-related sulfurtransferase